MKSIIIKLLMAVIATASIASCDKILEEVPKDRLAEENFYRTAQDAEAAVFSVYQSLRADGYYGWILTILLEAHSDMANGRGSFAPVSEYVTLDGTNIGRTEGVWSQGYQAVLRANIVLDKVPGIDMDETAKNAVLGEARFLRALVYFDLVRNYSGVPIRRSSDEPNDIARSSEAEVYQFIQEDLQFAENSLPNAPAAPGRPTRWAAKALLSYVYLTSEQWGAASSKAREVIDADVYRLVPVAVSEDFENVFGAATVTSTEDVFSLKFSANGQRGFPYLSYIHAENTRYSPTGFRTVYAHDNYPLIGSWSNDDLRKSYTLYNQYVNRNSGQVVTLPALEPYQFKKFKDEGSVAANANANDYPLLRYPDVLLIYAEATAMAGTGPDASAYDAVNQVRRRAYGHNPTVANPAIDLSGLSRTDFREAVIKERAYEFIIEGKRWYDLKRLGRDRIRAAIQAAKGKSVSDSYFLWPIPQRELDNNALINAADQNPGY